MVTSSEVTTESDTPAEPDLVSFCAALGNNRALRVPALFKPGQSGSGEAQVFQNSAGIISNTNGDLQVLPVYLCSTPAILYRVAQVKHYTLVQASFTLLFCHPLVVRGHIMDHLTTPQELLCSTADSILEDKAKKK